MSKAQLDHDDLVFEVGQCLDGMGAVCADLPSSYDGRHSFGKPLKLQRPDWLFSAFVPTQAYFSKMPVLPNSDWSEPDVVLVSADLRYVVDVVDPNDTYASLCRKIETVVANAGQMSIVGTALVAKPNRSAYSGKQAELDRLRETFRALFGEPSSGVGQDECRAYLEPLLALPAVCGVYGKVRWDRVCEVDAGAKDWQEHLRKHIEAAMSTASPMVALATGSCRPQRP